MAPSEPPPSGPLASAELLERLADLEHQRWSHWQRFVHSRCLPGPDGSLIIPAELVRRWEQQVSTPYSELTEREKDSDRDQVRRYLPVIAEALGAEVERP
jgi:hypothetical protein